MQEKLRVTVTFDIKVNRYKDWEAKTLEECAEIQQEWYGDGTSDITGDMNIGENFKFIVEPVEG